jgi:hypothetical protein
MCPNCFNTIAMALGGAGSALLGASLAAAGLRFRTPEHPKRGHSTGSESLVAGQPSVSASDDRN